jgi:Transposase and inactivated derivatives
MTRKKFTSKFKTKVVLEALKERMSNQELAKKFNIHPQQISTWKREFVNKAESLFEKGGKKGKKSEQEEKEDMYLKVIGQQKVELDFLKNALR